MEEQDTVELDLTDEEFMQIAKEAHMQDITFNQYVNQILKNCIETFTPV